MHVHPLCVSSSWGVWVVVLYLLTRVRTCLLGGGFLVVLAIHALAPVITKIAALEPGGFDAVGELHGGLDHACAVGVFAWFGAPLVNVIELFELGEQPP